MVHQAFKCPFATKFFSRVKLNGDRLLFVFIENSAWYESTTGRIALTVSCAGLALLVTVISMITYLCRRASQKKSKGPM